MQAISIRQPWAWLIAQGSKTIENRTWATSYRGPLLIHAGRHIETDYMNAFLLEVNKAENGAAKPLIYTGGIIGIVDLVDCVTRSNNEWFTGPIGWVLANARPLEPYPCKGKLGIFEVDYPYQLDSTPLESWLYQLNPQTRSPR